MKQRSSIIACLIYVLLLSTPTCACDRLDVTVTGTLSTFAKSVYTTPKGDLTSNDVVTINIPLEKLGANESEMTVQLSRTDPLRWRIDAANDLVGAPERMFQGPFGMLEFSEDGKQMRNMTFSLIPISSGHAAFQSPVLVTLENLNINDDYADVYVRDVEVKTSECVESNSVVGVKTRADASRDEFNPITEGVEKAFLGIP